jgi:hypothetical protein
MKYLVFVLSILTVLCGCSSESEYDGDVTWSNGVQVINGQAAMHTEYPSIVAMMDSGYNETFCTGTFIADDIVLTAGHCMAGRTPSYVKVAYGYETPEDINPDCFYSVLSISVNKQYMDGGWGPAEDGPGTAGDNHHDLALVLLDKNTMDEDPQVSDILPESDFEVAIPVGSTVEIAGYGINDLDTWESSELYAGEVPVMWRGDYETILGDHTDGDSSIGVDACYGDSGGPAYVDFEGKTYVTGATSRAVEYPGCGYGAIYTLPGSYIDWIDLCSSAMREDVFVKPPKDGDPPESGSTVDGNCVITSVPASKPNPGGGGSDDGGDGGCEPAPSDGGGGKADVVPTAPLPTDEDDGCGCSLIGTKYNNWPIFALILLPLIFRRRSQHINA